MMCHHHHQTQFIPLIENYDKGLGKEESGNSNPQRACGQRVLQVQKYA